MSSHFMSLVGRPLLIAAVFCSSVADAKKSLSIVCQITHLTGGRSGTISQTMARADFPLLDAILRLREIGGPLSFAENIPISMEEPTEKSLETPIVNGPHLRQGPRCSISLQIRESLMNFPWNDEFQNRTKATMAPGTTVDTPRETLPLPGWILAHVCFGIASIGVLIPVSTVMTSFLRKRLPAFIEVHSIIAGTAFTFSTVAFALPLAIHSGIGDLDSGHSLAAIGLFVMFVVHVLVGTTTYLRRFHYITMRWIHAQLFRVAMVLVTVTLMTGYAKVASRVQTATQNVTKIIGSFHVLGLILIWLLHEIHRFRSRRKYTIRKSTSAIVDIVDGDGAASVSQRLRETSTETLIVEMSEFTMGTEVPVSRHDGTTMTSFATADLPYPTNLNQTS